MSFIVKTEKKTVQFSDEVQVETLEPEPEPVYVDDVSNCTFFSVMEDVFK